MVNTFEAAITYARRGFCVVPIPHQQKRPVVTGWQDLRLKEADLPAYFSGGLQNIGILPGSPSGDLIDVDLDASETLAFCHWLPDTTMISGRASNPASHRFYHASDIVTTKYQDPMKPEGRTMLVELRSTGTQTIVPPSVHPSGETIHWEIEGEPSRVEAVALRRSVARVAAAALLARYWPSEGSRHDASLALAGVLLRGGWDESEVRPFVAGVAEAAGDDEWREREKNIATTARRLHNGGKATGIPSLTRLLTGDGEAIVRRVVEWLGIGVADRTRLVANEAALPEVRAWPAPPSEAAFYGLAGRIIRALEPHTEADSAALLINFLLMFGSAVGYGPHFMVGDTRHGCNLFAVLVGETAKARKGSSEGGPRRIMRAADEAWESARMQGGLSSGEGLIHAVRDPMEREQKNKETGNVERAVVDPGVSDKRLLATEEEYASVLRLAGRDGNILSPILRQAWDGKNLRTLSKNAPEVATAPHISVIGHITRDELVVCQSCFDRF